MPDRRKHRGRHPADEELFAPECLPVLRAATAELSWLLERGYAPVSALKLVGDHHQLRERQRIAVQRCACPESARARRGAHRADRLTGRDLAIDGFNCLITIEAGFAGGVVLVGRDGCHRDLASVHGSYRRVAETEQAIAAVDDLLGTEDVGSVRWVLDRPVSNSGRLRSLLLARAEARGLRWEVELVDDADRRLVADCDHIVASSDSWVLDHAAAWTDLGGGVVARAVPDAWLVDLGSG